mgnify:FL=1
MSEFDETTTLVPEVEQRNDSSPYLKYQDKNGDELPDVCDVDIEPPSQVCVNCKPNPLAIVRDWKKRNNNEVLLNEKICKYEITYVTKETTTGYNSDMTEEQADVALDNIYKEYVEDAAATILEELNKENNPSMVRKVVDAIQFASYHLEPRANSRLKLLYRVDFDTIFAIPAETDDGNSSEEAEESGDIRVKYSAEDILVKSLRVRKGLNLHSRFYKVYKAVDGGLLKFEESKKLFNLEDYGDSGIFVANSAIGDLIQELDSWLNAREFNLPGTGRLSFFNQKVTDVEFLFESDYTLKRIRVYTDGCGPDRPKKSFNKQKLKSLTSTGAWKDRTAVAYLAKLNAMERDLSARRPKPWLEFITEHTYPKVFSTTPEIDDELRDRKISTCIKDALANDFKQLGQDIFDEVFSLSDAIAYAFHKNLCRDEISQVIEDKYGSGTSHDNPVGGVDDNILAMAQMQAFKEVDEKDAVFASYCVKMLTMRGSGSPIQMLDQMWAQGFGRLKVCGLMDLLLDAIQCLFKGLSLEDALSSMIKSALQSMNVEDFGVLFVGLSREKQAELDALVKRKLEKGDIFPPGSPGQSESDNIAQRQNTGDTPFFGKIKLQKPWQNEKFVERQNRNLRQDNYGNSVPSKSATFRDDVDLFERRTLAKQVTSPPAGANQPNPNIVMQAYAAALLEVYQDNLFALVDELDKFPGAQLISTIIAVLDCPAPPVFNPGVMDFVKSLELPFCRNTQEIVIPRFENPFAYLPSLSDIIKILFETMKQEIIKLVIRVITLILVRICEMIGDAICKALETVGDIAASLPAILSGRDNLKNVIRETLCGPEVSDEQVEQTALDLLEQFGMGGTALADPETAKDFFADAMNSMTREEALTSLIDGPNETALDIMDNLIEFQYPQYRDAFPNPASLTRFFKNVGNVVPAQTLDEIKQALALAGDELGLPANPSLCASPETLQQFNEARCDILEGRMSKGQCEGQNEALRDQLLEDLGDLGNVLNQGIGPMVESVIPPVFSDPGCDNGLLPLEPKELQTVNTMALKGDMEKLQVAFTQDMLGNGGILAGKDDWGFINMVLSDTQGNPYTVHQRKTFAKDTFVDYYVENTPGSIDDDDPADSYGDFSKTSRQRGAYPKYVAGYLKYQFSSEKFGTAQDLANSINFSATNDKRAKKTFSMSFKDLGFTGLFGQNVELARTPDFGFNVTQKVDFEEDRVLFTREARKDTPDIKLKFRDNNKGYRDGDNSDGATFAYGFNLSAFYSDIWKSTFNDNITNRPSDNVRVVLTDIINQGANTQLTKTLEKDSEERDRNRGGSDHELRYRRFEFLAIDDGLKNVDLGDYPQLYSSFETLNSIPPQIKALGDLVNVDVVDGDFTTAFYNSLQNKIYSSIKREVGANEKSWLFGAVFDDLKPTDLDYLIPKGSNPQGSAGYGDYYDELEVANYGPEGERDGTRSVQNEDGVLGISRYQYEVDKGLRPGPNRVNYLNPTQHGGTYMNPPLYIAPLKASGWLGMTELMFPDYTPCKPRSTNLVGFDDINAMIDKTYPRIPEDKRLKDDPDCILEVPFNRILSRPSRAGIQGIIMSLTRIFASTHFMKALPVFSTFAPRFPESYSKIYAAYIVERMEESLRGAGNNFLSPFKDDEFWYAFLEQAVQTYARRVDDELDDSLKPEDVPLHIQDALNRLNNLQDAYNYPYGDELMSAKASGDAGLFETLKSYRESKNLEAVQEVDEDCKLILQEMVVEQLEAMGARFEDKLRKVGFAPKYNNTDYYFMTNFVGGAGELTLDGKFIEKTVDSIPQEGDNHYTTGDLFALPDGTAYVGEYHVHVGDDNVPVYMVGPEHVNSLHDLITPFAKNVVVGVEKSDGFIEMGDITETIDSSNSFYVKKKILINGSEHTNSRAINIVRNSSAGVGNISDSFPGTLQIVSRPGGTNSVGIRGNIGVQYALEFGAIIGGSPREIVTTTVDALDLPVSKFDGIQPSSKILLCLINNLRDEPKFRLTVDYIAGVNKSLSNYAIYCDMAFTPSIGEYTVAKGKSHGYLLPTSIGDKPGGRLSVGTADPVTGEQAIEIVYTEGWASEDDRNGFFASPFFLKWDEWDQELLRNTVRSAKRIFRPYYRKRKFDVEDDGGPGASDIFMKGLKERFRTQPGANFLPWWKRNRLRTSPFNADGQLCKKED